MKLPGSELVRGNYILQEFARIIMQHSFYMSCFLISVSILRTEWFKSNCRGKFSLGFLAIDSMDFSTISHDLNARNYSILIQSLLIHVNSIQSPEESYGDC